MNPNYFSAHLMSRVAHSQAQGFHLCSVIALHHHDADLHGPQRMDSNNLVIGRPWS